MYIDAKNTRLSNWLRYVNCARVRKEQNLVAYIYKEEIFYRALMDIKPENEMLVWYGDDYAEELGIMNVTPKKIGELEIIYRKGNTRAYIRNKEYLF